MRRALFLLFTPCTLIGPAGLTGCSKDFGSVDSADCVDDDGDYYCTSVDCNDANAGVNPGSEEIWYDGEDDDCDGNDDDRDLDGAGLEDDCDDEDPARNPAADEIWYDGVDQDCDGKNDFDADADGEFVETDCNDDNPLINHQAAETWYDGVDQDCAGDDDFDQDGDGVGWPDDCDDTDALEIRTDNCDGDPTDADGDGYTASFDCDDDDADVNPGASETWYDGVDSDCDGDDDFDADADGDAADPWGTDCDDTDPTVLPGAIETLNDGADQDCDGQDDTAEFQVLSVEGSTDAIGPAIAEFDGGLVINFLSNNVSGGGAPGALWHFLDPSAPWDGSAGTGGWSFSPSVVATFGDTYDVVADGDFLMESYVLYSALAVDIQTLVASASAGTLQATTLSLNPDVITTFEDLELTYDGTTAGVVVCEDNSSYEWVIYLEGTLDAFNSDPESVVWGYNTDPVGGGTCANRPSDSLVKVSGGGQLTEYRLNTTTGYLNEVDASSSAITDLDWQIKSGTRVLVGAASTLDILYNTTSLTYPHTGAGVPIMVAAALNSSDLYIAYVDSAGGAWLVYGNTTVGLTGVALDTGLTAAEAIDLYVTAGGALVVAARDGTDLVYMAVDL